MLIASGSFTGNATAGRAITGVGFAPDLVIIKNLARADDTWFKTVEMASTQSSPMRLDAATDTSHITALGTDGFTVSGITAVNGSAEPMAWLAMKDNGLGDFDTFTFTGDATDDKLVFSAFQPTYAFVKSDFTIVGAEKFGDQVSATANPASNIASMLFQSGADRVDLLYFGVDGLRVSNGSGSGGNLVNQNAVAHYGFAFKDAVNIKTGFYTGNGATQTVSIPFKPIWINIHSAGARQPVMQHDVQMSSGNTNPFDGSQITGKISNATTTGFDVANNAEVNTSAEVYHYLLLGANQTINVKYMTSRMPWAS